MLNIINYRLIQEIYSLNFFEKNLDSSPLLVITPAPESADAIRHKLSLFSKRKNIEVLTIANFIREHLKNIDKNLPEKFKTKKELFLILGNVWKKLHQRPSFDHFLYAYEIFSELRSFTTHYDLIEDILNEFDHQLKKDTLAMWSFLSQLELFDEHQAYSVIANNFFKKDDTTNESKQAYLFWDFNLLSSTQIDLIKIISQKNDVFIPVHYDILQNMTQYDWPYWLINGEMALNNIQLSTEKKCGPLPLKKIIRYPKGKMVAAIQHHIDNFEKEHSFELLLATNQINYSDVLEFPTLSIPFKIKVNLFTDILENFINIIKNKFQINKNTTVSITLIEEYIKENIQKHLIETTPHERDIRWIKIAAEFCKTLNIWQEQSEQNKNFSKFDLDLFKNILELDTPRTFFTPLIISQSGQISQNHIGSIQGDIPQTKTFICLNSNHQINYPGLVRSESIISKLASIGPIPRQDFSLLGLKIKLFPITQHKDSIFFVEEGAIESNIIWNEFFKDIDYETIQFNNKNSPKRPKKLLSFLSKNPPIKMTTTNSISASKLQDYIDCPRKYYINYLTSLRPRQNLDRNLLTHQIGTLEHLIIQEYFKKYTEWKDDGHYNLCKFLLEKFTSEKQINLSSFNDISYMSELLTYTKNTIQYLLYLKKTYNFRFIFESHLDNTKYQNKVINGKVDLLLYNSEGYAIIDFKRSPSGIPESSAIKNFEKIQTWFYINHCRPPQNRPYFWGYLCMKSLSKSRLYTYNEDFKKSYDQQTQFSHCKLTLYQDFKDSYESYQKFETTQTDALFKATSYPITPLNEKVCQYCFIKKICPKSEEDKI